MPKMKTHKSTARRFKVTATGKILRTRIGKSHLRRRKSKRVLYKLDKYAQVADSANIKRIRRLAPSLWKKR